VNTLGTSVVRGAVLSAAACFVLLSMYSPAQETSARGAPAPNDAASGNAQDIRDLQEQVRELRTLVDEMRTENAQSRAEMQQLRQDLQATRSLLERPGTESPAATDAEVAPQSAMPNATPSPTTQTTGLEERVEKLEESAALTTSKVDEQYQTKVETASKYRARLHGIVLMNAFRNVGASDNLDFPNYAEPVAPGSSIATIGATLRQSEIGLEIFGPDLLGAKTSADLQLDFAGGFPTTGNGVDFGIVRLQTGSVRFDWNTTSAVAGQDSLFISPLSPTSFASLATPAFGFAGNLWGWTPQLRVEHRFLLSDQQTVTVQAGVLDNLDWEFPYNSYYRVAQAGEQSGQPAYAARTAWSRTVHDHPLSFGVAGYYGRQNWDSGRYVDAWAGMADWQIPLPSRFSVSGEFYRGRGIGGLGAGEGRSIVYGGNPALNTSPIRGVNTIGGWSQLKFQLTPKIEFNGVIAQDDSLTGNIRGFATDLNNFVPIMGRNRGGLGNIVFRPRSDLVLSAELRRLQSFFVYGNSNATNQLNLAVGILF
jgi:hypothetical protein